MRISIIILSLSFIVTACKKKNSEEQEIVIHPGAVTLLTPQNNESCLVGAITGDKSKVSFAWSKDDNTDKYELVINDLKHGTTTTHETNLIQLDVSIPVNTPYAWYVRSKSTKNSSSSQSSIWKFYASGPGITSYAPFPADKLMPEFKKSVSAINDKITLSWVGSHVENNIKGYDIYLGVNTNTLDLIKADLNASSLIIDVKANTTYYWKVITKDSNDNQSDSGIYQFSVL